jgi:glycosyltransferase involved in cell wall biosynthesis
MHIADHDIESGTRLYQTKLPIYYPNDSGAPQGLLGLLDIHGGHHLGMGMLVVFVIGGRQRDPAALFGRHGDGRAGERYLGNLTSDEEMVAAYRAADLYVHPARMENAPCTIQESLACGTPVLAFAVGGIPEMVTSGKTGFLALQVGAACLQEALDNALSDGNRLSNMRKECRDWAEKIWNPKKLMQNLEDILAGSFKNTTQVGPT